MTRSPLFAGIATAALVAAPLVAGDRHIGDRHTGDRHKGADQVEARAALARGEILPIARILAAASAAVPGDVIEVELERKKWGWQYEVKILASNGRVREVELDARTARVLEIEED